MFRPTEAEGQAAAGRNDSVDRVTSAGCCFMEQYLFIKNCIFLIDFFSSLILLKKLLFHLFSATVITVKLELFVRRLSVWDRLTLFILPLLLVWQAWVRSAKHRHQSPEWTILSHSYRLIRGEIVRPQVLLDSLHPCSTRTSWWSPPVL